MNGETIQLNGAIALGVILNGFVVAMFVDSNRQKKEWDKMTKKR